MITHAVVEVESCCMHFVAVRFAGTEAECQDFLGAMADDVPEGGQMVLAKISLEEED